MDDCGILIDFTFVAGDDSVVSLYTENFSLPVDCGIFLLDLGISLSSFILFIFVPEDDSVTSSYTENFSFPVDCSRVLLVE